MTPSTSSFLSRMQSGLAVLFLAAGLLFFFWPMLFEGKVPFDRDFTLVTYPVKHHLHQAYQQGILPFWNPNVHAGTPYFAELHPGVFYPPSLFFFIEDFTTALNLYYVFHFAILAAGTYLLMRAWRVSRTGAVASAWTAALSGFIFSSTYLSNLFLGAVWLPILFWAFERFRATGRARWFVLTAFLIACQTLAACPEINIFTCGLLGLWLLFAPARREQATPAPRLLWVRHMGMLLLAVVLGLGLIALQLLPTYQLMQHSHRTDGIDYTLHTEWSLSSATFETFFLPHAAEMNLTKNVIPVEQSGFLESVYLGVFAPLFIVVGLRFWRDRRILFWLVMFATGLFLAFGKYNPLYVWVYEWVPGMDRFRYPEKYFYVSAMASVFLVGLVWDRLMTTTTERRLGEKWVPGAVLIAAAAVVNTALAPEVRDATPSLLILFAFGLTHTLFYFRKVGPGVLRAVFLMSLFLDLVVRNFGLFPLIDKSYYETEPVMAAAIRSDPEPNRLYSGRVVEDPDRFRLPNGPTRLAALVAMKEYMYPFLGTVYGMQYADGMPGLAMGLKDHFLWYRALLHARPETRFRILKRSNVKYWIDVDRPTAYVEGSPLILPDRLQVFGDALPRAFWVPRARQVSPERLLGLYYAEGFDPKREVLLTQSPPLNEISASTGWVKSLEYASNRVTVRTQQTGNGYLVLLDSYLPGWWVRVDGEAGLVLRANRFYRAVPLGPGSHTVEFTFTPVGWREGLAFSSVSAVLLVLAACALRRRNRTTPPVETIEKSL
ncbi:YfhO family protein [Nitrospina gracilis]|uniref:YfhO family protein n=1 Tax=Nitrospina gracilis TaxID=35801 RepID=UPI001F3334EA|nr:YfhO family protein [Nitrospina gracilis]MCF8721849.1 hypothetical protein [Nitrospina gracilis Nb-211]